MTGDEWRPLACPVPGILKGLTGLKISFSIDLLRHVKAAAYFYVYNLDLSKLKSVLRVIRGQADLTIVGHCFGHVHAAGTETNAVERRTCRER